jgi:hypothetical protein
MRFAQIWAKGAVAGVPSMGDSARSSTTGGGSSARRSLLGEGKLSIGLNLSVAVS